MSKKRSSSDKDLAFLLIFDVVFYVIFGYLTGLETLITRIMVAGIALISSIICWLFFSKKWVKKISDIRITIFSSVDENEKTSSYYSIAILLSLSFYLIFPDMQTRSVLMLLIILLFFGFFRKPKFGDEAFERRIDPGIVVDTEFYGQQKDDSEKKNPQRVRTLAEKIFIAIFIGVLFITLIAAGRVSAAQGLDTHGIYILTLVLVCIPILWLISQWGRSANLEDARFWHTFYDVEALIDYQNRQKEAYIKKKKEQGEDTPEEKKEKSERRRRMVR